MYNGDDGEGSGCVGGGLIVVDQSYTALTVKYSFFRCVCSSCCCCSISDDAAEDG